MHGCLIPALDPHVDEAIVLVAPLTVEVVANRIESLYLIRNPQYQPTALDDRVWVVAAWSLVRLHRAQPWIPVDPVLFVIAQEAKGEVRNPWSDLAQPSSIARYRRRIREIIGQLQREIRQELRRAEKLLDRGRSIDETLELRARWFSPMARYILAHKVGRADLSRRFRESACEQHLACPLYRQAVRGWLSHEQYPSVEIFPGFRMRSRGGSRVAAISLN